MKKNWIAYIPKGKKGKVNVKECFREYSSMDVPHCSAIFEGVRVDSVERNDLGDDLYNMYLGGEKVKIVVREKGQRNRTGGVFEKEPFGIFYSGPVDARAVKSALGRILSL